MNNDYFYSLVNYSFVIRCLSLGSDVQNTPVCTNDNSLEIPVPLRL
jgi:hypothetical protein